MELVQGSTSVHVGGAEGAGGACEAVQIAACRHLSWNTTSYPNVLGHTTHQQALQHWDQEVTSLLSTGCSPVLLFLLCSLHAPLCHPSRVGSGSSSPSPTSAPGGFHPHHNTRIIPPCYGVCHKARSDCHGYVIANNITWPQYLQCDDLPLRNRHTHNSVCLSLQGHSVMQRHQETRTEHKLKIKQAGCNCQTERTRLTKKLFRTKQFDYALRATYRRSDSLPGGPLVITIQPQQVLHQSRALLSTGAEVTLWAQDGCLCTRMKPDREYLILGHMETGHNRLVLNAGTVILNWKDSWANKIERWRGLSRKRSRQERQERILQPTGRHRRKKRRRLTATSLTSGHS